MVLQVDLSNLAEEAKRYGVKPWAHVLSKQGKSTVTIGDPARNLLIMAESTEGPEAVMRSLEEQGLLVAQGRWVADPFAGEIDVQQQIWVAAVAYEGSDGKPGLWVSGYRGEPSTGDVIRDFYEEMVEECGLEGVSLDDFVKSVDPNVVVLGPSQLSSFADKC
ncbi:MAG: hypothetical protein JNM34_11600 [Chthonomonadaceae bacterium]|nr:hypothetical protein [Chthonomonadaceae bacterium]